MKQLLKSCSLLSRPNFYRIKFLILFCSGLYALKTKSQIGNYVSNGSFESLHSYSATTQWNAIKYWQPIDSADYSCGSSYLVTTLPPISNAPYMQGYQYPRTGNSYNIGTFYCATCGQTYSRFYPRNRLKKNLTANKVYCAKYYVVNSNISTVGIDAYGIHFADSSLDTISCYGVPLTYLIPQVQNQTGNIITDTLNWVAITGTFVATGNEKYMVLGNFMSETGTNTIAINSLSTGVGTDVCMDDVSVIEVNLPAYAGPDKSIIPGDSVFIGREPDFAIDPGCMWYKLPNMTTAIDTISGLWVKPTVTTTYVVRQELDCSPLKWDTVIVFINGVGIEKLKLISEGLKIYPVPASTYLELRVGNTDLVQDFTKARIYNNIGQLIRDEEITFRNGSVLIDIVELSAGAYFVSVSNDNNETVTKKLLIAK